jgi:hypothetical protein
VGQYYFEDGPSKHSWQRIPILNQDHRDYNCILTFFEPVNHRAGQSGTAGRPGMKLKGLLEQ